MATTDSSSTSVDLVPPAPGGERPATSGDKAAQAAQAGAAGTPRTPRPGARNIPIADKFPRKFGKYHLLGPLAQGGMGALYMAVTGDRGLERLMVIKTVLPHLADAEYMARFRDEAKVVVKLSHGNLIPVFDAGQIEGELFIAMDFVEGRDLRAIWNRCAKKQVAFPMDIAVYIAKELCRGLHYAHAYPDLALVHRDVSPPNILISFTGQVKVTDFGLASSTLKLEKTAPGIIYGKVAYMSPEQARGEKLDGRSDLYAAGIVLWELLTGRQLFPPGKDQPADLVARAKNPDVMRPSQRAPRVSAELDEICGRALAALPADRYQTGEEMRVALQAWLAKHAPATDEGRVATFLQELFADDIERERGERDDLIRQLSQRALTLPPTDEFRQILERSGQLSSQAALDASLPPAVRAVGSVGRRASDRGDWSVDRRAVMDRRGDRDGGGGGDGDATEVERAGNPFGAAGTAPGELIGSVVDNRYLIKALIGEGGMGRVYAAEHIEIGKRVAIKVLHHSYSRMPDLVERFRREARAASKIGHPNIVEVFDSGITADEAVYFVMEYLEGVELGMVLERGALAPERSLRIGAQICKALAAAHAVGVIHRDLKPENIFLVSRDGNSDFVKVLDFGIAKTTEAEETRDRKLTSPGMAMGTPEYMAPEQAAGRPADARCDIYAVGAILYEMLGGAAPYRGDNFMEILTKKATTEPPPLASLQPALAPAVVDLVARAMQRDPDDRPASMEAFEYEINKCLAGRGAAVAQVLGMLGDGAVASAGTPMPLGLGASGAAAVGPGAALGPIPGAASGGGYDLSLPSGGAAGTPRPPLAVAIERDVVPQASGPAVETAPTRSRAGTLGWVLLAAGLAGGVALLLNVARGERNGHAAKPGVGSAAAIVTADARPAVVLAPGSAAPPASGSDDAGSAASGSGSAHAAGSGSARGSAASVKPPISAGSAGSAAAAGSGDKPPRPQLGPIGSDSEAQQVLDEGRRLQARGQKSAAREHFQRVAAGSYKVGVALLELARMDLAAKNYVRAFENAEKAAAKGGGAAARELKAEAAALCGARCAK
jgi:serine/threonine protein kinase